MTIEEAVPPGVDPTRQSAGRPYDNDPMILNHARSLLNDAPNTAFIGGDIKDPDVVLNHPELRALIDLDKPVWLMLASVVHFVPDDADPWELVRRYLDTGAEDPIEADTDGARWMYCGLARRPGCRRRTT